MIKRTIAGGVAAGLTAAVVTDYRCERRAQEARISRESHIVRTARGDVQLADTGDGPAVLMLHGSPGGFDFGAPFAMGLGLTGHRIIAPSRPGYLGTPVDSGHTPDEQADLMAALLDVLGVRQAVVVGISGGGPCALAMAQRHRQRCSHLVMIESLSDAYREQDAYAAAPPAARMGMRLQNLALKTDLIGYLGARIGRFESSGVLTGLAQAFSRYDLRRAGYELDMEQFAWLRPMPVDEVTMPVLVVHGSADTDVPVSQVRRLAERIPQAALEIVDGSNHLSLWASPQLGSSVADFLGRVDAQVAPPA